MNKLFTENGFWSKEGDRICKEVLDDKIDTLLNQAEDENELRLIGSLIQKRVADFVSKKIQEKIESSQSLDKMTDEEFKNYLDEKYKTQDSLSWLNTDNFLTKQEQARFSKLIQKSLQEYSEKIKKERLHRPCNCIKLDKISNINTGCLHKLKK